MSQKPPSDHFTRFTSTAPYSSSSSRFSSNPPPPKQQSSPSSLSPAQPQPQPQPQSQQSPLSSSSSSSSPSNSPPNETAAQRVSRLRAAHRSHLASTSQLTPVDKLISRGRTFADLAHRFTTYSLLAITGVSTIIAAYGIVSLVSHNRRQKRAWIERELDRLAEAQRAFLRGEANAEQLHLLEQERAGEEIARKFQEEKQRKKEEGVWARLKGTFGSFTDKGDMGVETEAGRDRVGETRRLSELVEEAALLQQQQQQQQQLLEETGFKSDKLRPVAVQVGPVPGVGLDEKGRPVPINKVEKVGSRSSSSSSSSPKVPGPLDTLAENVVSKAAGTGSTWWSWISGKPSTSSSSSSGSPSAA